MFLCDVGAAGSSDGKSTSAAAKKTPIPVNQVFDILPIRAVLAPGERDVVEFMLYGHANRKFKATAVCDVDGGPEYEVQYRSVASHV